MDREKLFCIYCELQINYNEQYFIICNTCGKMIHLNCVKIGIPGGLSGDIFFTYVCVRCSIKNTDEIYRNKISWATILILTLHNLQQRSYGLSRQGYFHWKTHIVEFIDKHWNCFFNAKYNKKLSTNCRAVKKKNWTGTVSGTLSHFSPIYFQSGIYELSEPGWWCLSHDYNPLFAYQLCFKSSLSNDPLVSVSPSPSQTDCSSNVSEESVNFSEPDTKLNQSYLFSKRMMYSKAYVEPSETLSEYLFADNSDCSDIDVEGSESVDISFQRSDNLSDLNGILAESSGEPKTTAPLNNLQSDISSVDDNDKYSKDLRIQTDEGNEFYKNNAIDLQDNQDFANPRTFIYRKFCPYRNTKEIGSNNCIPISEYEELKQLQSLRQVQGIENVPSNIRRLYRKLELRKLKRERNIKVFNLDRGVNKNSFSSWTIGERRVLDRFQQNFSLNDYSCSSGLFLFRLMGEIEPSCFYSPYTQRLLKPIIFRDSDANPPWLQLMEEVQLKVYDKISKTKVPKRSPIDYSYVCPQHIPTINGLLTEFFYPGVDITECLQYPDFSCVALYKKLIVGFAFMVPNVGYNEAYISFLFTRPAWRRAGIASFMLYHLIQTCMGRDVTLHVSATNPALILYQKFGFKVEEFVQDFYEKYFPADSRECKHALFLRLSR